MLKICALAISVLFPIFSNAATGFTELSNIQFKYDNGSAVDIDLSQFSASVEAQVAAEPISGDTILGISGPFVFDITATSELGSEGAYADADYDPADVNSSLSAELNLINSSAYSFASEYLVIHYKANSNLTVSFDLNASTTDTLQNVIGLYAYLYLDDFIGPSSGNEILNTDFTGSISDTFTANYFNTSDQTLYVYIGTHLVGYGIPIAAPVPEMTTNAMLFAGLGLLGFIARRRKSANQI